MNHREFLEFAAKLLNRGSWAEFSVEELRDLTEAYESIVSYAEDDYHADTSEIEDRAFEDGREDGYSEGYDDGLEEGIRKGYEEALKDFQEALETVKPNEGPCKYQGHLINQGVHWCEKHMNLYPDRCKYCKEFEALPDWETAHN